MKQKMILRNFKLYMKTSQNVLHLGTSCIILKVSKEILEGTVWSEERREKHMERMREIWKERKEAVDINVVRSGLSDIQKKNMKKFL